MVRLEDNYRSSPEILALANRLLAAARLGAGKRLVATRPPGPEPTVAAFENAEREAKALVAEVGRLAGAGVDTDEVAVLVRTNAQIPPLEEALAAAGIRYQVRGELFFRRTEVLRAVGVLRAHGPGGRRGLVDALEAIWFERFGFRRDEEPDGEEARQRHASLVTLLGIAERVEDDAGIAGFLEEVGRRAAQEADGSGGGVNLLTYHRARRAGVRRGPAAGGRGGGAADPAGEHAGRGGRGAAAAVRGADPGAGAPVGLVGGPAGRAVGAGAARKPSRFLDDLVPPGSGRVRPRAVASGMPRTGRSSVADGPWPNSCGPGGASGPRPTGCPPTWSSTTAPWPPSPNASPAAAASCSRSRASARASWTSTGTSCSPSSPAREMTSSLSLAQAP